MKPQDNNDKTQSIPIIAPGTIISHYKILSRLGTGGMGEVFLADDTALNRKVALKFLSPVHAADDSFRKRFILEAQAAARLTHPNIITVYEVSEINNRVFIAMEYIQGRLLTEIIKEDELLPDDILRLLIQICDGLSEAHRAGIVHRDIKPGNISIDQSKRVRIFDFGLAKTADSDQHLTRDGTTVGTPNYLSPEQGQGIEVDNRSDIFSVGIIIYEMITHQLPFKRSNMPATIHAIVHEQPEPIVRYNRKTPDGWQRVIDRALAKDPADRYQSVEELAEDLKRLQRGIEPETPLISKRDNVKPAVKSLAVLHLRNLGPAEDEFLSYGITEDLIVDLTRIGTIRVAPMRSVMKFKDSDTDLEEIAEKLEVTMVLDGSIHKSGSAIRVSAQLVDVVSGENLWAERWEEPPERLPQIKQALAAGISQALEVDSSVIKAAQVGTPESQNPQAYEFYLRGKYAFEHKEGTSDVEVALGLYRRALNVEPALLAARAGLAEILLHKGQYQQAADELSSALDQAYNKNLRADQAALLRLLSRLNTSRTSWDDATDQANKAIEISRELGDVAGEVEALAILIDILQQRSQFDEALALFERAVEMNRSLDDQEKAGDALKSMGNVRLRQGQYDEARSLYEEALKIARARNDHSLEAACIGNMGVTYFHTGDFDEALNYFEKTLNIHRLLGDRARQSRQLNNIAMIHETRGDYRKAMSRYEQAATTMKEMGDRQRFAMIHKNVAGMLSILGEYDKSIEISKHALAIGRELQSPFILAGANETLGIACFNKGEFDQATKHFEEALATAKESGLRRHCAFIHSYLGELHYYLEDFKPCKEHSKEGKAEATEIDETEPLLRASSYLAAVRLREGEYEKSIIQLRSILKEAKERGDPLYVLIPQRLLGEGLSKFGRDDTERKEGKSLLSDALQLATDKEISYEVKWISTIMN